MSGKCGENEVAEKKVIHRQGREIIYNVFYS
jgi:hypothetical protein